MDMQTRRDQGGCLLWAVVQQEVVADTVFWWVWAASQKVTEVDTLSSSAWPAGRTSWPCGLSLAAQADVQAQLFT